MTIAMLLRNTLLAAQAAAEQPVGAGCELTRPAARGA